VLGEVDELIIERIVDTGATLEEIAEALDRFEHEAELDEPPHVPSSANVGEVRAILVEAASEEAEEEEGLPVESFI